MHDKTFRLLALITVISFLIAACGGEPTPTPPPPATPTAVPTTAPAAPTETATTEAQATTPLTETVAATATVPATTTEAATTTVPATTTESATTTVPATTTEAATTTVPATTTEAATMTVPATTTEAATTTVPATATGTVTGTTTATVTEALANLTYQSAYTKDGTAPLTDGEYREPAAPGSATETVVTLTDQQAVGELNGAPAAAVVLTTEPGGSGTFYDLAVVMEQNGAWANVATTLLGDRVKVNSVAIADNQINVDMVKQGPNDPVCCPTQQVVQSYTLEGDQLTLASTEEVGTVEASAPVTATQTTTTSAPAEVTGTPAVTPTETVTASATVTSSTATTASASAGEASQLTVVSTRATSEIVGEKFAPMATVSPDGATMAWIQSTGRGRKRQRQLCLYTFASAAKVCYEAPEAYKGYPYTLAWSPDSAQIAFTENPIQLGYESDIWLFKRADGTFVDRTDDGLTGSYVGEDVKSFFLDYLPMWNKSTGELYFWRSQLSGNFTISLALYRMAPDAGEPELVRDVTDTFSQLLPWFDTESFYMDGVSALSPDGSKVALMVVSYDQLAETSGDGLWLVDLADQQKAPQHLATTEDFQVAVPLWLTLPAMPAGMSWTADGKGLVALGVSADSHVPLHVFYYVDIASGKMTPVVDFSDSPDMESFHSDINADGLVPRYYSPWTGTLDPAGKQLLMINDLGGVQGVLTAQLPPTGELPKLIYQTESYSSGGETRSSTASDGKVVALSTMFTLSEK